MQITPCTSQFASTMQRGQVGNGQYVAVLFLISDIVNVTNT